MAGILLVFGWPGHGKTTLAKTVDALVGMTVIDLQRPTAKLGEPCQALADRHFRAVVDAAGVKMISPHGMRHTSATLSLHQVGTPVKTVAERLGHAKPSMTLDVYTHSDEEQQQNAAEGLDAVLAR